MKTMFFQPEGLLFFRWLMTGLLMFTGSISALGILDGKPLQAGEKSVEMAMPVQGISAHRGASWTHPENTLAAIQRAVELGVHQIEIDLRLTKDSQLVLMHDDSLVRTTDVAKIFPDRKNYHVSEFTLAELKRLDAGSWKDEKFAGQKIPTFEEALQQIPLNMWINLDIKGQAELGRRTAQEVVRFERSHQAIFSVRGEAVKAVLDYAKGRNQPFVLNNMNRQQPPSEYIKSTVAGEYQFIQLIGKTFPDQEDLQKLKDHKIRINYCCTNQKEVVKNWLSAGIEFPLVDDAEQGMEAAQELGIEPLKPVWKN